MTEDEAFIRAIVDSPGDDTPRLVYADWLDERDDTRGPYLRAEHTWAKPWRDGKRPVDSPELRTLATGLDPVWVARVSRPSVGVCCEHVRFVDGEPRIVTTELDEAQRGMAVVLPAPYRAFLLNYNGGRPVSAGAAQVGFGHPVESFDPLSVVAAPDSHPLRRWLRDVRVPPVLEDCIPIGMASADSDAIYLGHAGRKTGRVYIHRDCQHSGDDPESVEFLSMTFEALIARIKVRREHA